MMGYTFKPNTSYMMPVNCGPVRGFDTLHYDEQTSFSISYVTDKDALAALLPEPFEPADEPVVDITCVMCRGTDFLAGRGYNVVSVGLAAVFNGKKDHIIGRYQINAWMNDTFAILVGRELLGISKLYADIPDPQRQGNNWRFLCSEYGTKLIEVEIRNPTPVDDATCRQMEQAGREGLGLHWKYIPRADWKGADLSFPTAVLSRATINQAWFGEGSHRFFETTWEETPVSAHIMKGLQTLVVKEYRPAVIAKGSSDILIAKTQRIE